MGFSASPKDAVYHYHSNYDSFHWMSTYGDPTWNLHVAAGQFLAVLALNLAEQPLLPLNVTTYAKSLWYYYSQLEKVIKASTLELELEPLHHAIKAFEETAAMFMDFAGRLDGHRSRHDHWMYKAINNRLKSFERAFVGQGGLPNREFYKHCMSPPQVIPTIH